MIKNLANQQQESFSRVKLETNVENNQVDPSAPIIHI